MASFGDTRRRMLALLDRITALRLGAFTEAAKPSEAPVPLPAREIVLAIQALMREEQRLLSEKWPDQTSLVQAAWAGHVTRADASLRAVLVASVHLSPRIANKPNQVADSILVPAEGREDTYRAAAADAERALKSLLGHRPAIESLTDAGDRKQLN